MNDSENTQNDIEFIDIDDMSESSNSPEAADYDEPAASDVSGDNGRPPRQHRKLTRGDIIRYAIMAVAVGVFIFAAVNLIKIFYGYKHADNIYSDIDDKVVSTIEDNTTASVDNDDGEYPNIKPTSIIDFDTLKSINSDAVGWVQVPSVNISYPIVRGTDNDYYLNHAFNNEFSWSGSIFMDYRNETDLSDTHAFLYGHHMNDGSMFAGLLSYDDESFFKKNENNNYFYIYLEKNIYVYQIFSVCDVNIEDNPTAFTLSMSDAFPMSDYLSYLKSVELYDTGITATGEDTIVTLFTCQTDSSSNERHMVHGKLITVLDNN